MDRPPMSYLHQFMQNNLNAKSWPINFKNHPSSHVNLCIYGSFSMLATVALLRGPKGLVIELGFSLNIKQAELNVLNGCVGPVEEKDAGGNRFEERLWRVKCSKSGCMSQPKEGNSNCPNQVANCTTKNAIFSCVFLSCVYKNAAIEWL